MAGQGSGGLFPNPNPDMPTGSGAGNLPDVDFTQLLNADAPRPNPLPDPLQGNTGVGSNTFPDLSLAGNSFGFDNTLPNFSLPDNNLSGVNFTDLLNANTPMSNPMASPMANPMANPTPSDLLQGNDNMFPDFSLPDNNLQGANFTDQLNANTALPDIPLQGDNFTDLLNANAPVAPTAPEEYADVSFDPDFSLLANDFNGPGFAGAGPADIPNNSIPGEREGGLGGIAGPSFPSSNDPVSQQENFLGVQNNAPLGISPGDYLDDAAVPFFDNDDEGGLFVREGSQAVDQDQNNNSLLAPPVFQVPRTPSNYDSISDIFSPPRRVEPSAQADQQPQLRIPSTQQILEAFDAAGGARGIARTQQARAEAQAEAEAEAQAQAQAQQDQNQNQEPEQIQIPKSVCVIEDIALPSRPGINILTTTKFKACRPCQENETK
ncbi:hypothetical protein ONZ43_g2941 [Nemania bipapillata]|uniref:Uncharacterized protein n=1 Tax=Nemania bipapillata TaxID=110536 RepID=A0ACC2IYP1_9PEZI|nr:hypothetical protein ONZ43_g2941 [Nemania bipapillata]